MSSLNSTVASTLCSQAETTSLTPYSPSEYSEAPFSTVSRNSTDNTQEQFCFSNKKARMKRQRHRRTAGAALGGAIVGGLALGPLGAVAGGIVGGVVTKKICKGREKRVERKHYDTFKQVGNLPAYNGTVA